VDHPLLIRRLGEKKWRLRKPRSVHIRLFVCDNVEQIVQHPHEQSMSGVFSIASHPDALTVRGIRVDDIMSMKRSQVHSLIAFARVRGHRITYPVGDGGGRRVRRQG
jgi:hypothetical protein